MSEQSEPQKAELVSEDKVCFINLEQFNLLPDGTELINLFGQKKVKGVDQIDHQPAFGYLEYGILEKNVPKGMKINPRGIREIIPDKIWLITRAQFDQLADGVVLTCINGKKFVKGKDRIEMDVKFGYIAYGFSQKEKPTGMVFEDRSMYDIQKNLTSLSRKND